MVKDGMLMIVSCISSVLSGGSVGYSGKTFVSQVDQFLSFMNESS